MDKEVFIYKRSFEKIKRKQVPLHWKNKYLVTTNDPFVLKYYRGRYRRTANNGSGIAFDTLKKAEGFINYTKDRILQSTGRTVTYNLWKSLFLDCTCPPYYTPVS